MLGNDWVARIFRARHPSDVGGCVVQDGTAAIKPVYDAAATQLEIARKRPDYEEERKVSPHSVTQTTVTGLV